MRLHHYPGLFGDPRSRGLTVAVAASLVVHVVLFATAGRVRTRVPERTFFAPVDLVDWVEPKAAAPTGGAQKQPPAPPPAAEKAPPTPPPAAVKNEPAPPKPPPAAPKTSPAEKAIPKEPATPAKPPAPRYSEEDVAAKIARMREQLGTQQPPEPAPPAAPAEPTGDIRSAVESIRQRVGSGDESGGSPAVGVRKGGTNALQEVRLRAYYNRLWDHVTGFWAIPPSLKGKPLSTIASVVIDRQGNLVKTWIEETSGSDAFDQSALSALKRAAPLPPIPDSVSGDVLEVGFRFHPE